MPYFKSSGILLLGLLLSLPRGEAIPFKGTEMLISAPSPYAVQVGQKIAEEGGNVVDVAVGIGLTLAVTSPYFGSLGGGGFAMVKMDGKVEALDFREVAPKATAKDFFVGRSKEASIKGGAAVGVPGVPAGLWELHKKFGKLKWRSLFQEPLKFCKNGFRVSGEWVEYTHEAKGLFEEGARRHFLRSDGSVPQPGELLKQFPLAQAMTALRDRHGKGFYSGPVAEDLVSSVQASGGVITLEDLANYQVRWLAPMQTRFRDHTIYLMPPPSSGGVVLQSALDLTHRLELSKYKMFSIDEYHLLGEILARSFRGRLLLGDPDFNRNPLKELLGAPHLERMAKSVRLGRTTELELPEFSSDPKSGNRSDFPKQQESPETTHFVVMDRNGNTVSLTVTLNGNYGSGVATKKFGIALNNEMDDFTTRPNEPNQFALVQGQGNQVEPGKRPLSSMSPTIVEKDGETVLALGAPGGPRIISAVFQALYRVLVSGLDIDQAIQSPRVHHQFRPHVLMLDRDRFTPETIDGLRERGHKIEFLKNIAKVYGIRRHPGVGLEAAFDARGEGAVGGH